MNPIKQKYGLTTDQGTDAQAPIMLALGTIVMMPDTHVRSALIALCLIVLAVIKWLTVGHKADSEYMDLKQDLQEVLGDGRDN